jgi:hypothetical protein
MLQNHFNLCLLNSNDSLYHLNPEYDYGWISMFCNAFMILGTILYTQNGKTAAAYYTAM